MKKSVSDPEPDDMRDEYDFSTGKRGVYYDWYQKAKGRFRLVTDAEDRRRQERKKAEKSEKPSSRN